VAEDLESLSDEEPFERRSAAMRMLPDTIDDPAGRRRVWDVLFRLDQEIQRRWLPVAEPSPYPT
jgi:hypothetical protein